MVRKSKDKLTEVFEHKFNGDGFIKVQSILNNTEEMNHKGRTFAHTTILPGHSIGFHIHDRESETYYIYSGEAEFNDDGIIKKVSAGDVTLTPPGHGHGIKNIGNVPLEIIALILFE